MEVAAQDRAGWSRVSCDLCSTAAMRHKSSMSNQLLWEDKVKT